VDGIITVIIIHKYNLENHKYIIMSYSRPPYVGEIVIVPLVHPNGVYIRLADNSKINVLGRIRSVFGETANIINIFGYIYNVPFVHIELLIPALDNSYYQNMVNNASRYMTTLGYRTLDNREFFNMRYTTTYSFLSSLPGFTPSTTYSYIPDDSRRSRKSDIFDDSPVYKKKSSSNGSVDLFKSKDDKLIHYIKDIDTDCMFDSSSGELYIKGYATFICDSSFTYKRKDSDNYYVIFRSENNFIHISKEDVKYTKFTKSSKIVQSFDIKFVKLDSDESSHSKYFKLLKVIDNEF
jgi:hypothetical protein